MYKTRSSALPKFNVGLHPAPGASKKAPFYFPAYRVHNIVEEPNGAAQVAAANPLAINVKPTHQVDRRYMAEYFSGKVFAVGNDGEVRGYPDKPVGIWRDDVINMGNKHGGKRRRRNTRRKTRRQK